jgi:hypothetical protein
MCRVIAAEKAQKDFLGTNKKTIRSIGFHKVKISSSQLESNRPMSLSMLCSMLNVPPSTPCQAADCRCLPWWKEGSRLMLSNEHLQRSAGTSAK